MSSDEFEGASEWFGGKRVNPMKLKRRTRLSEKKKYSLCEIEIIHHKIMFTHCDQNGFSRNKH